MEAELVVMHFCRRKRLQSGIINLRLMKVKPWPAAMMEQPVIMEKDEEVKKVYFMSHEKSWYFVLSL